MKSENKKLLNYIEEIFGEEKKYLKVSEIGYVITVLIGTDLTITGEKVNFILAFEGYQTYTEDDEYFSYIPKNKKIPYEKFINKELNYGIIKWHYSIISVLLNIDFRQSIQKNMERIKHIIKSYGSLFMNYEIDDEILENELSQLLN